jgi:hypothetical protein
MIEKPPDFSSWNTNRIRFLLTEYKGTLPAMRTLYGKQAEEAETLQLWIDAMEKELLNRHEQHP